MVRGFLTILLVASAVGIPIDNDVIGDPEIECGPTSVGISANTKNNFEGQVFVKGLYEEEGCTQLGSGLRTAFIILPFDSCNVQRIRSANPRGIFVTVTIIISFHPKFLTKVDKAYKIQCFYMEADKTVSAELEVSPLTTALQTENVPMPVCRYDILDGGPDGPPVKYVLVGQQVYHKWTCVTETTDVFCMVVHSCFVNDGSNDKVQLLDSSGCAVDKFLLRNLEYPMDLMAGQEAHAFKYADRLNLFFQCQISISIKEPNEKCTRPTCPALRLARSASSNAQQTDVDVSYSIDAYETDDLQDSGDPWKPTLKRANSRKNQLVCLSNAGLGSLIIILTLLLATILTVGLCYWWKRRQAVRRVPQSKLQYLYFHSW